MILRPERHDPLPRQPAGLPWPTTDWPKKAPEADVDHVQLEQLLDTAFGNSVFENSADGTPSPELGLMLATVVVHRGHLVSARYGETAGPQEPLISWSMAKSVVHAWAGLLTMDGLLDVHAPTGIPEWADDLRSEITVAQLLDMTSGLEFNEDYVDDQVSHVIEMLFGEGQTDTAGYARDFPLVHAAGSHFNYSSGTTNIVARICGDLVGDQEAVEAYLQERLFEPLGMQSADPRFDDAGTFIGSSFLYCTAEDFARFGYLYLRNGMWEGQRLLPDGWADDARSAVSVPVDEDFWYGHHWWLWDDSTGGFACHGYEGQYIIVIPARDLIVVRLGKTPAERKAPVIAWLKDVIACFPEK